MNFFVIFEDISMPVPPLCKDARHFSFYCFISNSIKK